MDKSKLLTFSGLALIGAGLGIFLYIFFPLLRNEVVYDTKPIHPQTIQGINPVDSNYGLVIPKIGANAKVIDNVDPYNVADYQGALTKGVAHANTSVEPDQVGNVFIFAHSAVDFLQASRYNSLFYLLGKLEAGDKVYIFYKGKQYQYLITSTKIVNPTEVNYLTQQSPDHTLTLMTCWPAGISFQRLLVFGKLSSS